MMNKNSETALERNSSTDKTVGQHPIFRLVRPALIVACLYVLFIGLDALFHHHNVLYYVHIGPRFSLHIPHGAPGYDGQFFYQIARNPFHAASFIDRPSYRYQRIIYPLLVTILSLGKTSFIPYMLLLVNFVSIVLGTELLARLFVKQKLSPWYSLAFGLYFGQATAFIFDLTEPLTYFLVCLGLFLLLQKRTAAAALCMGFAVLSRETAILFPLGYIILYLYQKRWQDVLRFLLLSIAPTVAWYVAIALLFHTSGLSSAPAPTFELIPFQGLFVFSHDQYRFGPLIILMLIPTLLSIFLAAKEVLQHRWKYAYWLIWLFNLALVTNMSLLSYVELVSAGRLSIGLVLAMLLHGLCTRNRTLLRACQVYTLTFPIYTIGILVVAPFR
ncbi:MAG: hypothetical protein ABI406_08630 [Ktedonobacteraceae bacterium]